VDYQKKFIHQKNDARSVAGMTNVVAGMVPAFLMREV